MIGCKICTAERGITIKDCFKTEEEFMEHMENEHGIPVAREGETLMDAKIRCSSKGILTDRSLCQCGDCKRLRKELQSRGGGIG